MKILPSHPRNISGQNQSLHRRADLAMRLLISERAAITQAAEVVVAVPAHVRVPVPEAGEPDARKKIFTEQSLRQWQSARR